MIVKDYVSKLSGIELIDAVLKIIQFAATDKEAVLVIGVFANQKLMAEGKQPVDKLTIKFGKDEGALSYEKHITPILESGSLLEFVKLV